MVNDSFIHAVAGAAGGILAMTATYPLVFLSTRAANETQGKNKSTYQAVVDVLRREGLFGLYNGLDSSLLGIAVANGVYYYFYESTKGVIVRSRSGTEALSTLESILAGLISGSATTVISNPVWVIQAAQTVSGMNAISGEASAPSPSRRLGVLATAAHLLHTGGPAAFFRGLTPALVLVVNPVLQYTFFEQLKNALVRRRRMAGRMGPLLTDWDFFLLGAVSKFVATGVTYPYIVVKSRLQAGHATAERYRSALHGLRTIIAEEGIGGIYKGVGSKLLQSVLTAAILFASQRRIYELTKKVTFIHVSETHVFTNF
ncbi:peroxisomal membrane protein PMP47B [Lactifluus subvellereus]|nr:peroxisomal membrane protein PMP47B [Lactifluus subvellereus]KAI0246150.1 peroxisomal membrane protein PMP47B [Lactifluus subvellereus]